METIENWNQFKILIRTLIRIGARTDSIHSSKTFLKTLNHNLNKILIRVENWTNSELWSELIQVISANFENNWELRSIQDFDQTLDLNWFNNKFKNLIRTLIRFLITIWIRINSRLWANGSLKELRTEDFSETFQKSENKNIFKTLNHNLNKDRFNSVFSNIWNWSFRRNLWKEPFQRTENKNKQLNFWSELIRVIWTTIWTRMRSELWSELIQQPIQVIWAEVSTTIENKDLWKNWFKTFELS